MARPKENALHAEKIFSPLRQKTNSEPASYQVCFYFPSLCHTNTLALTFSVYHRLPICSSLSYVFNLFKLSEEKAAEILVSLCRDMGDMKISSAGKLLFFGSRILKSPEGKAALEPIKTMIKATYREATVAETMVETSQQ